MEGERYFEELRRIRQRHEMKSAWKITKEKWVEVVRLVKEAMSIAGRRCGLCAVFPFCDECPAFMDGVCVEGEEDTLFHEIMRLLWKLKDKIYELIAWIHKKAIEYET